MTFIRSPINNRDISIERRSESRTGSEQGYLAIQLIYVKERGRFIYLQMKYEIAVSIRQGIVFAAHTAPPLAVGAVLHAGGLIDRSVRLEMFVSAALSARPLALHWIKRCCGRLFI